MASRIGAVWDSAGEQNGTEMPWIQQELDKRGLKAVYAFIATDPETHQHAGIAGVIGRAAQKGRMVDTRLFAESYGLGAKNFRAFRAKMAGKAEFIIIDSNSKQMQELPDVPDYDVERIYRAASQRILAGVDKNGNPLPDWVKRGALIGERLFK
jgi:hypothetical protein